MTFSGSKGSERTEEVDTSELPEASEAEEMARKRAPSRAPSAGGGGTESMMRRAFAKMSLRYSFASGSVAGTDENEVGLRTWRAEWRAAISFTGKIKRRVRLVAAPSGNTSEHMDSLHFLLAARDTG